MLRRSSGEGYHGRYININIDEIYNMRPVVGKINWLV